MKYSELVHLNGKKKRLATNELLSTSHIREANCRAAACAFQLATGSFCETWTFNNMKDLFKNPSNCSKLLPINIRSPLSICKENFPFINVSMWPREHAYAECAALPRRPLPALHHMCVALEDFQSPLQSLCRQPVICWSLSSTHWYHSLVAKVRQVTDK